MMFNDFLKVTADASSGTVPVKMVKNQNRAREYVNNILETIPWEPGCKASFVFGWRKKGWPSCTSEVQTVVSLVEAMQGKQGKKLVQAEIMAMLPDEEMMERGGASKP